MKKTKSNDMFVNFHNQPKTLLDENLQEFVLLSAEDYNNLEAIRRMKISELNGVGMKMIKIETLMFLDVVMQLLLTTQIKEFVIYDSTCILKLETESGIIDSCFSTDLCEKYYGKPLKFIEEVL